MLKRIALPFLLALSFAHAQRRSPLADAPAIRKRVELRETRLEFGAGIASTINQTFYHGLMANVRLGFHITDWLSVSGMGAFNVSSLSTGFQDRVVETLGPDADRAPSVTQAKSGMNKQAMILGGQLELTPFTGKYSLFGKLFAHYDFYLFGGGAFVKLASVNPGAQPCSDTPMQDTCVVTGSKIGGTFGGGFHSFFNNFVALHVELRDILIKDNPAGRNVNGDRNALSENLVDNKDLTWTSHLMASIGLTLYLPSTAGISP
ncbi:MAG: outer membrane beta-barrel domain-containing protein [Pseudomonadota bacterium]